MNRLQCLIRLARALDYNRDPDPEHWKTINGAKVHVDENGNYDGGAGGKFTGRHHYGPDWKQKTALTNRLANALRGGVTQKQAQGNQAGNQAGNTSTQSVMSKLFPKELFDQIENPVSTRQWFDAAKKFVDQSYEEHKSLRERSQNMSLSKEERQKASLEDEKLMREREKLFAKYDLVGFPNRMPPKIMEMVFAENPEKAEKAYKEKKFRDKTLYLLYEKWKEKKRT